MKSSLIGKAIKLINPSAKFTVHGDNTETIDWLKETTPISENDIKNKIDELEAQYISEEYKRNRKLEYPTVADQLDDIYHNGVAGWKKTIKAVKDKYPKE
tara:strand:- start:894 stop:1193 length:300 start_codon:yes stop_codon:yes gene_type:complete